MAALGVILFVVGAILTWGLELAVDGADLGTIGVILMVAGVVAFLAGLVSGGGFGARYRTERHVSADGRHVVEQTSARDF